MIFACLKLKEKLGFDVGWSGAYQRERHGLLFSHVKPEQKVRINFVVICLYKALKMEFPEKIIILEEDENNQPQ